LSLFLGALMNLRGQNRDEATVAVNQISKWKQNSRGQSQALFICEIKFPRHIRKNGAHPDYIKLCNNMKDELDRLTKNCCDEYVAVCGLSVEVLTQMR
jgi:hypothetical protein